MATVKKVPGGGGGEPPDITKALVKASTKEAPNDAKSDLVYQCVVGAFDKEGLNHIGSPSAKIVWSTIDDEVILSLGDDVTECIRAKGFQCPLLAPAFQFLKNNNKVTVVADLVTTIARSVARTVTGKSGPLGA